MGASERDESVRRDTDSIHDGNDSGDSENDIQLRWYAVYTEPNREQFVLDALRRLGITCFHPWYTERVRTSQRGRYRLRRCSLFPRYTFASAPTVALPVVSNTNGVCYVVSTGGVPECIPNTLMHALIRRALPSGEVLMDREAKKKRFKHGEILKIVAESSPLRGMLLTFLEGSDIIHGEIQGKGLKISVPLSDVEKYKPE